MNIKIKDNLIDKKILNNIYKTFESNTFPWYYYSSTAYENDKKDFYFQFAHIFYINDIINSDYFNILNPILNKINPKKIIKIKANLTTMYNKVVPLKLHTDFKEEVKGATTSVYYINDNNGYTVFPKLKKQIKSKANRLVSFPVNTEHTGTTHTNKKIRLVINFNYFK